MAHQSAIAAALGVALAAAASPVQATSGPAQSALDATVAPLAGARAPGCVIEVTQAGARTAFAAFGRADLEHDAPIDASTVFEVGSVAKQFTAAATMLLVADGKLSLGDDVRKYVPELPTYGARITIDQLLNHTSGLRDWSAIAGAFGWEQGTRSYSNEDALRVLVRQRSLNHPPGREFSYTNSGYNLLAIIIERVSGESLAAFSQRRIFRPLGMTSTQWRDNFRRVVPNRAIAYVSEGTGWEDQRPFENIYGHVGLLTTVGDLGRWNEALRSGRPWHEIARRLEQRATLSTGQAITYGRGLMLGRYRTFDTVGHSGSIGGYRAWLQRVPAQQMSIAILCNGASFDPQAIGIAFLDRLWPPEPAVAGDFGNVVEQPLALGGQGAAMAAGMALLPRPPFVAPVRAAPVDLTQYLGTYRSDEVKAAYQVSAKDGALILRLSGRATSGDSFAPSGADLFRSPAQAVRFERNPTGKVIALEFDTERAHGLKFVRTD